MEPDPLVNRAQILVNKVDKGYIILAAGNGTAPFKGSVYAILLDKPEPEAWVITEQPQHGKNVYTYVELLPSLSQLTFMILIMVNVQYRDQ